MILGGALWFWGGLYGSGGGVLWVSVGLGGSLWDIVGLGVSVTPPLFVPPPQFCWEDPELETTMGGGSLWVWGFSMGLGGSLWV